MLAQEEASQPSKPKGGGASKSKKPASKPAGPGALSAGGINSSIDDAKPQSFGASGLDDALEMMSVVGSKTDKASVGARAGQIEKHPERRFKAAFEAYKEANMPIVRSENPGLRLQQYNDLLYKNFQKSPDNPFNQQTVAYNATKEDKVNALNEAKTLSENRFRQ